MSNAKTSKAYDISQQQIESKSLLSVRVRVSLCLCVCMCVFIYLPSPYVQYTGLGSNSQDRSDTKWISWLDE